jgi:hypothetical protein
MICDICKTDRSQGETVKLTPDEIAYLKAQESYEKATYFYCSACWGMMKGKHASKFMANHFGMSLAAAGISPVRSLKMVNAFQKSLDDLRKRKNEA